MTATEQTLQRTRKVGSLTLAFLSSPLNLGFGVSSDCFVNLQNSNEETDEAKFFQKKSYLP
jgi:hypothetical protein